VDYSLIPIFFVVFLFSLSFHEAAHAWMAERFGDPTARYLGRVTLNPIPHIDVFGTIVFPLICMLTPGAIMFGWAKPVPVNTLNMKDRRMGDIVVSLAGPVSNAILVVIFFTLLRFLFVRPVIDPLVFGSMASPIEFMLETGAIAQRCSHDLQPASDSPTRWKPRTRHILSGVRQIFMKRSKPMGAYFSYSSSSQA
jgi:hypothetical protein